MSGELPITKRGRRWRPGLLAAGLVLLVGLGIAGILLARWLTPVPPAPTEPTDPRLAYAGPYRNVDPRIGYVGDAACAGCHNDIAQTYARHPMGRSLVPAKDLLDRQRYGPDTNNPFLALGRRFEVKREGDRLWHRQAVPDEPPAPALELAQEVRWVIGSGQKGYSYLTEKDGYLFQTPISWFTQKQRWDLSPGFVPSALTGRVVQGSCLFCHANRLRPHPDHPDQFEPPLFEGHAIGCERCHGPGELHAQGDFDRTIVNPVNLAPPLRDAVCEQCHLEGEARILRSERGLFDYRPGMPLYDFWAVLVQARASGEDSKAVNHVEQMYQSKCFQRPVGGLKLGCITCHNPHVYIGPEKREAHYRARCLQCHDEAKGQHGCSEPLRQRQRTNARDSCIDCHMPRYTSSDVAHTASTDHRIVRRPIQRPVRLIDPEKTSFIDFYRDRFPQGDPQTDRTLGMGLVKMMNSGMLQPERHAERAVLLLESARTHDPRDVELRASKVQALLLGKRASESLAEAESILVKRPEDWRLLAHAAIAAGVEGQTDLALGFWRRAVEINPFVPDYQVSLLSLLIRVGRMDEARIHCQTLLQLDPFNVSGRQAWVGFLLQEGKHAEARKEFDLIRRLKPPDLARREEWFQQQTR
jgi:hypothetical protein